MDNRRKMRRKGIALIWLLMVAIIVIGLLGMSVDVGYAYLVNNQLQNAADAASLAGAQLVRNEPELARAAALMIAAENAAAGTPVLLMDNPDNTFEGDVVIGLYDRKLRTFSPTLLGANAVKVNARRTSDSAGGPVNLLFGPIFGIDSVSLARRAIAMIGGGTGAGLIALNREDKWTFRLSGTQVTLDVYDSTDPNSDGLIQVNSYHPDALKRDGDPNLLASEIRSCAEIGDPPDFGPPVRTEQPYVPDPLADLVPPPPTSWTLDPVLGDQISVSNGEVVNPEPVGFYGGIPIVYYPQGLSMTGGDVTLGSGIYVLGGEGLNVTGGNLIANNVMFYIVGTGSVKLVGNGIIEITALDAEPYAGMAIWQESGNTSEATITGTGQFTGIDGTLYFPDAHVNIGGTSDSFEIRQVIVDSIEIFGNGTVTINYDGRNVAPGTKVFLVE